VSEDWIAAGRTTLAEPGSAPARLRRLGLASVRFNQDNALLLAILRRDKDILFAPLEEQLYDEFVRANVVMIAEVIRDGIDEGTFQEVDPERAAYILFSAGNILSIQNHYPYSEILPLFEKILQEGLLAGRASAAPRTRGARGRARR
jgi:hypothetical protein